MTERGEQNGHSEAIPTAPTVEIFEPPMCCPTGLCGPSPDQALLDVQEMVRTLEAEGVKVARYQPGSHPAAFAGNGDVMREIHARSTAALPVTLVGGRVLKTGAYPSLGEIRDALSRGGR